MKGINKAIVVGTLGKDPELKYSQAGKAMCNISVATNEKWKDKNGEAQERTDWHVVKFFDKLAEIAGEYLKKGGQVYIEGRMRTDKVDYDDGTTKYFSYIAADELQMLGAAPERSGARDGGRDAPAGRGRGDAAPARAAAPARSAGAAPAAQASRNDEPFPDDDIPF